MRTEDCTHHAFMGSLGVGINSMDVTHKTYKGDLSSSGYYRQKKRNFSVVIDAPL